MKTQTKCTLEDVLKAIDGSGGIKATIALRLGVARNTFDTYLRRWATAQEAYTQETETNTDIAESIILGNMQAALQQQRDLKKDNKPAIVESGDAWKYLQYKGRERGYAQTTRGENLNVDLTNLTDDQLERLAKGDDLYAVLATSGKGGA